MAMPQTNIWVGFITYGELTAPYLPAFLASLRQQGLPFRAIAFDNTPAADNLNRPALAAYPEIEIVHRGENIGFSRAYNIMIDRARRAGAEYFLVINPDTLLESGALDRLAAALTAEPSLGSVAPKLRRWDFQRQAKTSIIDSCGLRLRSGLRFSDLGQGAEDDGRYDAAAILGPSGAAGLFRVSALARVAEAGKCFDESFFMYKEDCDLAYRLSLAGFGSRLVPEALVFHDRSDSGGSLRSRFANRFSRTRNNRRWAFINQHLLFIKYWRRQTFFGKWMIIIQIKLRFLAAFLLEPYLLKEYRTIGRLAGRLHRY